MLYLITLLAVIAYCTFSDKPNMDVWSNSMWYVDNVWFTLLYSIHFTFIGHCNRQVNILVIIYIYIYIYNLEYHLSFFEYNSSPYSCFRYWAVTQVNYIHQRNIRTIGTMILLIWLTSVIVSLAPLMGWKDEEFLIRIKQGACMVRLNFVSDMSDMSDLEKNHI